MEQNELEKAAHENYPYGNNATIGSLFRATYEQKKESFKAGAEWQKAQEKTEVLENLKISEVVEHFSPAELLVYIGQDECYEYLKQR